MTAYSAYSFFCGLAVKKFYLVREMHKHDSLVGFSNWWNTNKTVLTVLSSSSCFSTSSSALCLKFSLLKNKSGASQRNITMCENDV